MKRLILMMMMLALLAASAALADTQGESDEVAVVIENQVLVYGDECDEVAQLQKRLAELYYYDGEFTGSYGDKTRAAVKAFQADFGLEATGDADIPTQEAIFTAVRRPLRLGSMGDDVKQLQSRLKELGYFEGKISGAYLPGTQEAVAMFQQCSGENGTGIADLETLFLLYSEDAIHADDPSALIPAATPGPDSALLSDADVIYLTPAPTVAFSKQLKYESKGESVKQVQRRLTELGYYEGNISGNFLGNTRNAVKAFQKQNALEADGIIGEATWNALFNDLDVRNAYDEAKPTPAPTPVAYAITVDVRNQVTTVYGLDENGEYTRVVRQMLCSTGTQGAPSDVGDWVLSGRTARWCYFPKWGGHAQYWTKINSSIAFHSVLYRVPNSMELNVSSYKKLGQRASHGCIRLTVADAKWIYDNCGKGVVVTITEKLPADPELRAALKLPGLNTRNMLPYNTPQPTASPEYVSGQKPQQDFRTMKKNSKGEDVYWLQCKLKELGYYTGHCGGTYLDGTVKAVKAFQKANGLSQTGTVDLNTWKKLYQNDVPAPTPTLEPLPTPNP